MRSFRSVHAVWTLANVSLSLVLVVAWWVALQPIQAVQAASVPTEPQAVAVSPLPQGSVRFVAPSQPRGALGMLLPSPLAVADPWSDLPDTLLRLTPKVAGVLRMRAPDRLEFMPASDWPAATAIMAVLDPEAPTTDARRLGAQASTFIGNPLMVEGMTVLAPPSDGPAQGQYVRLRCNHPITAGALTAALGVAEVWTIAELRPETSPSAGPWTSVPLTSSASITPTEESATWRIHVVPQTGIDANDVRLGTLIVRCAGSLVAASGGEPLGIDVEQVLTLHDRVELQDLRVVEEGIVLRFRRELPLPHADLVTLTPPRAVTWERRWDGLLARCAVEPGELVRVQAPAAFPGHGRYRLAAAIDDVVRVGDAPPSLDWVQRGSVLSTAALPILDVSVLNVDRLTVRIRRVYDNNQVRFAERDWRAGDTACTPWRQHEQSLTVQRNHGFTHGIDLREVWGEASVPTGWYEIEVQGFVGDDRRRSLRTFLQISDIACAVRADGGDIVVWAWSLADGNPLPAAEIQVLTRTNQRLAHGRTDATGMCTMQHSTLGADQDPHVVVLRHGDDQVAIDLTRFRMEMVDASLAGERDPVDGRSGWLWTERGLVRPGEALRVLGMVRDEAGWAPLGEAVELRLFDPGQRQVATVPLTLAADGMFSHVQEVSAQARHGTWRWELWGMAEEPRRLADAWTRVESFVPDRIVASASLGPLASTAIVTDLAALHLAATVHATTGEAVAGATVEARLRIAATAITIPGRETYSFGPTAGAWPDLPPGVIAEQRLVTDAEGVARWTLHMPPMPGMQAVRAVIDGAALDPGGRALPIAASATVLTTPTVLGVQAQQTPAGVLADILACTAAGEAVPLPEAVTVRVERRQWTWDLVQRHGRHDWRTSVRREEIARRAVTTAGAITLPCDWDAPSSTGHWLVVVVTRDGIDWAEQVIGDQPPERPDRLRVRVAEPVRPGGHVTVDVVSPLAGQAFATIEGQGIHHVTSVDLVAGANRLEFPLPETIHRPNLHVVIMVAAPQRRHQNGALWLVGAAPISISHPERELNVTVICPADSDPEQPLPITVHAPGANRALVVAVDEAVLARTRHASPDPAARFRARRSLQGRGATSLADLMTNPRWKEAAGGDGDEDDPFAPALSARSADLDHLGAYARWEMIDLDAAGQGTVAWDLADFEGRVRIMVIAATPRACGAADASCVVRAPLGVRLALPRVIAPGDTVRALLTVSARQLDGPATVHVTGGAAFTIDPQVELPALAVGVPVLVPMQLTARHADAAAAITVTVKQAGLQRTIRAPLPIRPAARWVEEYYQMDVSAAQVWQPDGAWQGPVSIHVRPARDRRDELRSALATLVAYPYGCGEQTAAQTVVMAACASLAEDEAERARSRTMLAHGAAHLRTLGTTQGFTWWQGERTSDPVLTVLIVRALWAAKEAGIPSDAQEMTRWLEAVEQVVRRDERTMLRCQGVAVLALGGRRVATWIDALAERITTVEEHAWLALAAARSGDRVRAQELLQQSDPDTATMQRSFDGLLRSPMRCAAVELAAWLAVDPGHQRVRKLAERLMTAVRRPRALTTQELAHILPALTQWCSLQAAQPAAGTLTIDGQMVDAERGWQGQWQGGAPYALTVSAPTWVLVTVQGWRTDAGGPAAEGLRVQRRWRSWTDGKEATTMQAGHVYAVELLIDTTRPLADTVVTDLMPAGYEIEASPGPSPAVLTGADLRVTRHRQHHDDRVIMVLDPLPAGQHRVVYAVRALLPGTFHAGAPALEAFYDPSVAAVGESAQITVVP